MTLHCLLVDPPLAGFALEGLIDGPVDAGGAASLYAAGIKDAMAAAELSGGELLVNYPADEQVPAAARTDASPETVLREMAADALSDPEEARFEVQVGSSVGARAGNAATHLLTKEDEDSVAILRGDAPMVDRTVLDGAAMKLRRHPVVLGPGTGGRLAYLGLSEPIDFDGAYDPPEIEDLTDRGVAAGHDLAFLAMQPVIADEAGLAALVAETRARKRAGLRVPTFTADAIDRLGLRVTEGEGGRRTVESTDRP